MGISHVLFSLVTKFGFDSNDFLTLEKECSMDFVLRISLPDWLTNQPNKIKRRTHYNIILLSVLRASVSLCLCVTVCVYVQNAKKIFLAFSLSATCLYAWSLSRLFSISSSHFNIDISFYSIRVRHKKKKNTQTLSALTDNFLFNCLSLAREWEDEIYQRLSKCWYNMTERAQRVHCVWMCGEHEREITREKKLW